MRSILQWLVAVACLIDVFGANAAFAGKPLARPANHEACEHLDRGNRLYNLRSFDEAIKEFKAGALIEPAPVFDYNLGQAYRQLGKYKDALWHYDRFLKYGQPAGELLDAVNRFMAEMRAQLANGVPAMSPTDAAEGPPSPSVSRPATESHQEIVRHDDPAPPIEHDTARDWFGWSITGAGVVGVGAAGFLFLRASSLNDQANSEPDARRRNDLHDQARTRNLLGAVIGIGGGGLIVTGVIKLALHSRDHAVTSTAALDIGISGHGVVVSGRF
jgi:tetratricopeptide (TPR) repeat protein